MSRHQAFTLIELLIVVAIIGILAAIAVPNFLNARIRAEVARVEGDLKSISTAHEMWKMDNGNYIRYPVSVSLTHPLILNNLTTPLAYINGGGLADPFYESWEVDNDSNKPRYYYQNTLEDWVAGKFGLYNTGLGQYLGGPLPGAYIYWIGSCGPDLNNNGDQTPSGDSRRRKQTFSAPQNQYIDYDPSNGIESAGDITRLGP
ncbi:MAG: prepilin-type N-terminal cleavage/methylation domain-containing protein [bacterium]